MREINNLKTNLFSNIYESLEIEHNCILMNKDIELLQFKVIKINPKQFYYTLISVNKVYSHLLPYLLLGTKNKKDLELRLQYWLEHRVINTNRQHIEKVLESLNLKNNSNFDLLMINHGASLNDTFWIKIKAENINYNDIELYHNKWDTALGVITFFGNTSSLGGQMCTPELTTQGVLRKCWIQSEHKIELYKGGTTNYVNAGREPLAEVIASKIGADLNFNTIQYNLVNYKRNLCSSCELFTSEDVGLVTMHDYLYSYYRSEVPTNVYMILEILKNKNYSFSQSFLQMLLFDFIINNQDRHLSNYGFLRDLKTGEIYSFAPLYDNGMSLHYNCMSTDLCVSSPNIYYEKELQSYIELLKLIIQNISKEFLIQTYMKLNKLNKSKNFKLFVLKILQQFYKEQVTEEHFHYKAIKYLLVNREQIIKELIK